ncbi:hypothetical protein ACERII_13240 [Evansella sp. AB-rgal1]|uniref:hypothetical protein n=1 Tax=Evansella sp. AB-rgal1 TaxID=3242696 RepID=UPI00359EE0D9
MKSRMVVSILLLIGCFAILGNIIYKLIAGDGIVLSDVIFLSMLLLFFFFTITWGSSKKKDGILPSEELGKQIQHKSASVSYYMIVSLLFVGLIIDRIVTGTPNTTIMILFGLSLVIQPFITYVIAQTFQIHPNSLGKIANWFIECNSRISKKTKNRMLFIIGFLTALFIISPLFETSSYYDLLTFLFGEPGDSFNPFPLLFSAVVIGLLITGLYYYEKRSREGDSREH